LQGQLLRLAARLSALSTLFWQIAEEQQNPAEELWHPVTEGTGSNPYALVHFVIAKYLLLLLVLLALIGIVRWRWPRCCP
jgi:hypothetical protein